MLLDELVAAIKNVKSRIEHHQNSLRQSEALTRYSLIDPMLRALGWDTTDPTLVTPEYEVGGKRADYALLEGNQVVVFLEAKRLDENLSTHRSQVAAYASELGIKYPALTNGNKWEVYDNSKLVPIDQRQILNVSINESPSSRIALQLLLLWQPNLASGEPVSANEPIFSAQQTGPNPQPTIIQDPAAVTPPSPSEEGWTSLADLQSVTKSTRPLRLFACLIDRKRTSHTGGRYLSKSQNGTLVPEGLVLMPVPLGAEEPGTLSMQHRNTPTEPLSTNLVD